MFSLEKTLDQYPRCPRWLSDFLRKLLYYKSLHDLKSMTEYLSQTWTNNSFLYTHTCKSLLHTEGCIHGNYCFWCGRGTYSCAQCRHWDLSQVHARKPQLLIDSKYISLFKIPWGSPVISFPNCEQLFAFNLDLILLPGSQMATPPEPEEVIT